MGPGTANFEAVALATGDATAFDPALEIRVDPALLSWDILPLKKAKQDVVQAKLRGILPVKSQRRRKPVERLRNADSR